MALDEKVTDQLLAKLMNVSGVVARFSADTGKHQTDHLITFPSTSIEAVAYAQSLRAGQPPVTPS